MINSQNHGIIFCSKVQLGYNPINKSVKLFKSPVTKMKQKAVLPFVIKSRRTVCQPQFRQ
jgi:hypothetical protein